MYVDWEYYKIFYYVAKYQNFTKAARVLGNNQPNITHSMNRLESQLNCVLFIRSNRGVTLTPEGEMLYSRIASAAVQIQDAEEELSASATLEHGTISISATETALNIYLSKKLRDFHTEYPGIRLRISNHSTPQAVLAVKNGEVDFAIVSTPAEIESGLKMVELKPFYEVLVGGRTFTALAKMDAIIHAQGGKPFDHNAPQLARLAFEVMADADGLVAGIDNHQLARIARLAGAPKMQGSGVDLLKKLGDPVKKGEPLYRVHADYPADLDFARQASARASGYAIGGADEMPHLFVEF